MPQGVIFLTFCLVLGYRWNVFFMPIHKPNLPARSGISTFSLRRDVFAWKMKQKNHGMT